ADRSGPAAMEAAPPAPARGPESTPAERPTGPHGARGAPGEAPRGPVPPPPRTGPGAVRSDRGAVSAVAPARSGREACFLSAVRRPRPVDRGLSGHRPDRPAPGRSSTGLPAPGPVSGEGGGPGGGRPAVRTGRRPPLQGHRPLGGGPRRRVRTAGPPGPGRGPAGDAAIRSDRLTAPLMYPPARSSVPHQRIRAGAGGPEPGGPGAAA